ncbi:MAG TPA: SRPBCC family protein [Euzebyales bacterium]|nr:SRPBCC family protein [Euzebyales bacterium]
MTTADRNDVARASTSIDASSRRVWSALVDPEQIARWMVGTTVDTDWREGSPVTWKGEWQGTAYEDKGTVLRVEEGRVLQYTHYSPLSGQPDVPENYHTVTIELVGSMPTEVTLSQDGNDNSEMRDHSAAFWQSMLDTLKQQVERDG